MPKNETENALTPKQRIALDAIMLGGTVSAAAAKAKVGRATVYRWQRDPAFAAELRRLEGEALQLLGRRLLALSSAAAAALVDGLKDDQPIAARLRAADLVIGKAITLAELSAIVARVTALETRLGENNESGR